MLPLLIITVCVSIIFTTLYYLYDNRGLKYGATTTPDQWVIIEGESFNRLAKYSFERSISVRDAITELSKSFPPKSISIGYMMEIDGKDYLASTNNIPCDISVIGYNKTKGVDGKDVFTLNTTDHTTGSSTVTVGDVLFPGSNPDIVVECQTKPAPLP